MCMRQRELRGGPRDMLYALYVGVCLLCHEVDASDLLTELEDDGEGDTVTVSVVAHLEHVGEGALGHFNHGVLDLEEFLVD